MPLLLRPQVMAYCTGSRPKKDKKKDKHSRMHDGLGASSHDGVPPPLTMRPLPRRQSLAASSSTPASQETSRKPAMPRPGEAPSSHAPPGGKATDLTAERVA